MKSPRKFLVQLSSRRPAKVHENSIGHDADPEGRESEAENKSALPSDNPTEASSTPDQDADGPIDQVSMLSDKPTSDPNLTQAISQPIDIQEAKTPAPSETNHSGAGGKALGPKGEKSKKPQEKSRIARRERPKRARTQVVPRSAVATNEAQSVQPSSSGDPFFNEVANLDAEIKELRRRLAQKLYLQNDQLKKMLERFDVS
ncbi:hypothetical protein [Ensifer sp. LCM 4579]|uniref:hypothetical protein n=1 Tax=Ensifer sp. LCM 4579 TaxID=1848292 RepID=UPI0008DB17B0|nr:hypothetical protein [Ensifer sp. LCM 4579]OHV78912.1 hypothetical protein LCM4579_24795 [Ensifer sp. LCM 4579]